MSSRRGKHEGSIYQVKDGRWVANLDLGWSEGKRKRKYIYGTTRREVAQKLNQALRSYEEGKTFTSELLTVEKFLESFLKGKRQSLRYGTWRRYKIIIRKHIVPEIGKVRLSKLEPHHLIDLYDKLLNTKLSPTTVLQLHRILHCALHQGVQWGTVARNVASLVTPPRRTRRKVQTLSTEEASNLLEAARSDRLYALYILALTTGMRQGELLGLTWDNVFLNEHRITISSSLQPTPEGKFELGETKTAGSRRQVALSIVAIHALIEHKRQQEIEKINAMGCWNEINLVFPNIVGNPISPSNLLKRSFSPLLEKAGLHHMRFHDLRHTAATLLLSQGTHPKIVSEMLGHSQISITLDLYSHVTKTMQQEVANTFDKLFMTPFLSGRQIGCQNAEEVIKQ